MRRPVIDGEIQQTGAGAGLIVRELQPSVIGHLPFHEQAGHWSVVGWAPEKSFVPAVCSIKIGHRHDGEQMIDGHGASSVHARCRHRTPMIVNGPDRVAGVGRSGQMSSRHSLKMAAPLGRSARFS
ncbi:hypothetical protein [Cryobacterium sp. Y82]|uniref:hypothetical protein n=1 Tax=Cryobacterium sp. Y82 TaxID=2045017 RepID=UPI001304A794|nr:hypothetical protein [Cryobacterium sp. Y82]